MFVTDGLLMSIHLKHVRLCIHESFHGIFSSFIFSVNFDVNVYDTYVAILKTFGNIFCTIVQWINALVRLNVLAKRNTVYNQINILFVHELATEYHVENHLKRSKAQKKHTSLLWLFTDIAKEACHEPCVNAKNSIISICFFFFSNVKWSQTQLWTFEQNFVCLNCVFFMNLCWYVDVNEEQYVLKWHRNSLKL